MPQLSIVIICRNEASAIGITLQSLQGVTDDIVVYDNGSTDGTQEVVKASKARLFEGSWEGFGKTKQKANALAQYDWILSLDADESVDEQLKQSLQSFTADDNKMVFDLQFKNFLGNTWLKYGEWGGDHHIRLFNRQQVYWDDAPVHENLVLPAGVTVKKLPGFILHRTMKDIADYSQKTVNYALLSADKYRQQGKKSSWFKLRISPAFSFFNHYILKLGFMDGHAGYICAKMTAWYTFLKYSRLKELNSEKIKDEN
jgi:glycosyltransferase involved in cell wall biosynthesis